MFFGGTSLLIMVGVVLDTLQQIESYLLMRKYDGLVKSGKLKGRSSGVQGIGADRRSRSACARWTSARPLTAFCGKGAREFA